MMNDGEKLLFELLFRRYREVDGWALFPQVPDGTGHNKSRTADAIAMNLWPSRGLEIHGFEFKKTRSDWLSELARPEKAESIFRHCDRWWIVSCRDVVKTEELPPGWGLLVVNKAGDGLRSSVTAKGQERGPEIPRAFVAGLLRAASANGVQGLIENAIKLGRSQGRREMQQRVEKDRRKRPTELDQIKRSIAEFEEASGVKIQKWDGRRVGEHVKAIEKVAGYDGDRLGSLVRQLETAIEGLRGLQEFVG